MKKITLIGVIFSLCVFGLSPAAFALKMNIDPPRVELKVKPGESTSGAINVLNYDEEGTIHVKVYIQDMVYLPDGSNDFLPIESTPWSLKDFLKVGPTEFDLQAGQAEMVRYVAELPQDAKGGFYGVVFFEVVPPPSQFKQAGANISVRLGSVILVDAEGTESLDVKLKSIDVTKDETTGALKIGCAVFNNSNILTRPNGTIKIIDEQEVAVAEIPINKDKSGVFPNTNRTYYAEYKDPLKPGAYVAQAVLDYGGEEFIGGQKKFTVE